MADFQVRVGAGFDELSAGFEFESTQGITLNSNGDFILSDGTFLAPGNITVPIATVGGVFILPLVDIAATISNQRLIAFTDENGIAVYPPTIDIISPTLGALTVNFQSGPGFTVTDANGDPVFDVPADLNLSDSITNDGEINGCLLYTSPSPRDKRQSRMPSSA